MFRIPGWYHIGLVFPAGWYHIRVGFSRGLVHPSSASATSSPAVGELGLIAHGVQVSIKSRANEDFIVTTDTGVFRVERDAPLSDRTYDYARVVVIFRTEVQRHVQDCALVVHYDRCPAERENDPALSTLYRLAHEGGRKHGDKPVKMSIIPVDAISHIAAFAPAFEHKDNQNTTSHSCSSDGAFLFEDTGEDGTEEESNEDDKSEEEEDEEEPPEQFGSDPELDQLQDEIMSRLRSGTRKHTVEVGTASTQKPGVGASAAPQRAPQVGTKRAAGDSCSVNIDTLVYRHFEMVDAPH